MAKITAKRIKQFWVAGLAGGLTVFFLVDLVAYFYGGDEFTMSAALRSVLEIDKREEMMRILGAFLCGVWFSHLFQFGHTSE